jgi:tetratricopeptide (TPR) repeat protein
MKRIFVFLCLIASFAFAEEPSWRSNYNVGIKLADQKKFEEAIGFLRMAAADKPISQIVTEGGNLEYLPYLQIGIAYYQLGKYELAGEFFDLESALPAVTLSKTGESLLKDYREKLTHKDKDTGEKEAQKTIRDYSKKPYLLPEMEVQKMKEDIRQKCNLPKAEERSYPWYYHYELGLALKQKNDWQRALDSFINALDFRDQPQKFSRIYGMWFVDYYPYYYIGLAHFNLGNWKCADDSFRLSQMLEDIPSNAKERTGLLQYKAEAEQKLAIENQKN